MLKAEGVDLPTKASGYLLYRQANLDKESEAELTTRLQGDFSLDAVLLNLRKLDRVAVESKRGTFFEKLGYDEESEWPEEEEGEDYFPTFEPELEGASTENGEVIEEDDLIDILASYQDVQSALRQNRNARGLYPPARRVKAKEALSDRFLTERAKGEESRARTRESPYRS